MTSRRAIRHDETRAAVSEPRVLGRSVDSRGRRACEFDDLPGAGRPIPGAGQPYDRDWWLKEYLKREKLSLLRDTLRLGKHVEEELERIEKLGSEIAVRRELSVRNETIARELARATSGPSSRTTVIDIDNLVGAWGRESQANEDQ